MTEANNFLRTFLQYNGGRFPPAAPIGPGTPNSWVAVNPLLNPLHQQQQQQQQQILFHQQQQWLLQQQRQQSPALVGGPFQQQQRQQSPAAVGGPFQQQQRQQSPALVGGPFQQQQRQQSPALVGGPFQQQQPQASSFVGTPQLGHLLQSVANQPPPPPPLPEDPLPPVPPPGPPQPMIPSNSKTDSSSSWDSCDQKSNAVRPGSSAPWGGGGHSRSEQTLTGGGNPTEDAAAKLRWGEQDSVTREDLSKPQGAEQGDCGTWGSKQNENVSQPGQSLEGSSAASWNRLETERKGPWGAQESKTDKPDAPSQNDPMAVAQGGQKDGKPAGDANPQTHTRWDDNKEHASANPFAQHQRNQRSEGNHDPRVPPPWGSRQHVETPPGRQQPLLRGQYTSNFERFGGPQGSFQGPRGGANRFNGPERFQRFNRGYRTDGPRFGGPGQQMEGNWNPRFSGPRMGGPFSQRGGQAMNQGPRFGLPSNQGRDQVQPAHSSYSDPHGKLLDNEAGERWRGSHYPQQDSHVDQLHGQDDSGPVRRGQFEREPADFPDRSCLGPFEKGHAQDIGQDGGRARPVMKGQHDRQDQGGFFQKQGETHNPFVRGKKSGGPFDRQGLFGNRLEEGTEQGGPSVPHKNPFAGVPDYHREDKGQKKGSWRGRGERWRPEVPDDSQWGEKDEARSLKNPFLHGDVSQSDAQDSSGRWCPDGHDPQGLSRFGASNRLRESEESEQALQKEHVSLLEQEVQFDRMFKNWEENFNRWQLDNMNNPDREYVNRHVAEMNKIRDRMLARRESLQQRRQDFKERKQQAQPQKDYPPQFGEFERKAMQAWDEVSTTLKNEGGTPANCGTSFSGSDPRTAGGIPGLGDGEDVPLFERKKDVENAHLSNADRENISRAIEGLTKKGSMHDEQEASKGQEKEKPQFSWTEDEDRQLQPQERWDENPNWRFDGKEWEWGFPRSGRGSQGSYAQEDLFQRRNTSGRKEDFNQDGDFYGPGPSKRFREENWNERSTKGQRAPWRDAQHDNDAQEMFTRRRRNEDDHRRGGFDCSKDSSSRGPQPPPPFGKRRFSPDHSRGMRGSRNEKHFGEQERLRRESPSDANQKQPPPPPPAAPQGDLVQLGDLLDPPGRYIRPPRIVFILRGLPGSGKSHLAKAVKAKETELGSDPPRILSLDDYFECDGEYDYEAAMEDGYRQSLVKSFKKQIDDGLFNFIIVDCINDKTRHYEHMWSHAKQKGFEIECDVARGTTQNVHKRTEAEIRLLAESWEETPAHFHKVDLRGFLQENEITEVDMEDAKDDADKDKDLSKKETEEEEDVEEAALGHFKLSKWEVMDNELQMARLDGVSKKARQRVAAHDSIEEWLELRSFGDRGARGDGKKRVRWADIEEQQAQLKMREVGFVVGQTNWKRMMDPSQGGSALTQTKIIPSRFD